MSSCTTIPSSLKLFFKLNQFWSTNFITFHKAAVNTKNCWNTWTRFYNSSRYNVYLRSVTTAKGADSETGANHVKDSGGEFALHALQFGRLCLQRWPSTGKMKKEKNPGIDKFWHSGVHATVITWIFTSAISYYFLSNLWTQNCCTFKATGYL